MDKREIKDLDLTFKVYTKLQLKCGKYETFTPDNLTDITICGMKAMKAFKLPGQKKKEKLIQLIKLLVKEHYNINWQGYDLDVLHSIIDSLYDGGLVKGGCC